MFIIANGVTRRLTPCSVKVKLVLLQNKSIDLICDLAFWRLKEMPYYLKLRNNRVRIFGTGFNIKHMDV